MPQTPQNDPGDTFAGERDPDVPEPKAVAVQCREMVAFNGEQIRQVIEAILIRMTELFAKQGDGLDKVLKRLRAIVGGALKQQAKDLIDPLNRLEDALKGRVAEQAAKLNLLPAAPPMPVPDLVDQGLRPAGDNLEPARLPAEGPMPLPMSAQGQPKPPPKPAAAKPAGKEECQDCGDCPPKETDDRLDTIIRWRPWGKHKGEEAFVFSECGWREMVESYAESYPASKFTAGASSGNMDEVGQSEGYVSDYELDLPSMLNQQPEG